MTDTTALGADPQAWTGQELRGPLGDIVAEQGYVTHWCEATQNANPLYWDPEVADELVGGPIAPPTMVSVWMRPLMFKPDGRGESGGSGPPDGADKRRPLELHFRLKEAFDLPDGIVSNNEIVFHAPVRLGDRVRTTESVREVSDLEERRLGTGRFWVIDVTYTNQHDEVLAVESYRMFSYKGGK